MILVIGESGTGKSTSIKNLDSEKTFVIQSIAKPMPFRGWRKKYKPFNEKSMIGNLYVSDKSSDLIRVLDYINTNLPNVENVIIDDFQYIMSNDQRQRF